MDVMRGDVRALEPEPLVVPDEGSREARPRPPRRTLGSDLRRLGGTPARRARLLLTAAVLALVVAVPLVARSGVSDARADVRAQGAERSAAADARTSVEAGEREATARATVAADEAAQARVSHNEQRRRLAGLGLNEETVDAYLVEINANAELVEYWRDSTSADVDRQAAEIPQMQDCVRVASRALNGAWNAATFGDAPPPSPSDLCRALLDAGT